MAAPRSLDERLRALLAGEPSLLEKAMFGGRSFMVDDRMVASARANADLLVRVDPTRSDDLVDRAGASPAQMGDRTMARGWIQVAAESLRTDKQLKFWIDAALEFNRASR